ncbi:uncharacterized protein THITE_2110756 [Thermothielavioides terrestris NRRL 8126]|uniref:Uncharacterized protein n=1 Tax=Thermothielavioides terrestris (strain ATCC 38088 / NRRL 8126) TaxID=578455 RepID=G2QUH2_THETT|nr:uncharacterized protein THITE_2110756 [Thermothielavioides terrestris NRRL 8126]AEO64527.1 hypothetical protein THITE_2110756 [Thermothielavioides terrestris NRRL 8126]
MSGKAPSAGTKVTTGENIPTTREAPGKVAEESLAAESARKGGAFAANPGQEQAPQKRQPQPQSSQQQQSSRSGTEEGGTAVNKTTSLNLENQQTARGSGGSSKGAAPTEDLSLENQQAYGGPAPSYVLNQRHRDPAGPHGKNLTEGGFEGSGTAEGPLPEPGSIQDPARVAARDLRAGMAGRGGDAGRPRQTEGVEGKSWYTPLGGDEPA